MFRFLFFLLFLLVGCSNTPPLTKYEKTCFGMPFRLLIGPALSEEHKIRLELLVQSTFEEADRIYNDWNPESEISKFNQLPADQKTPLSPTLATLIDQAGSLYHLSDGKFDPTIGSLQRLWKTSLREGVIPLATQTAPLLSATGWPHIHSEKGIFWKDHPLTSLDLGGISKGYAIDLLAEKLLSSGFKHFLIEWGGEVRVHGGHPEGRPWHIGIAGMGDIDLMEGALATSGDYFQCWEVDGETYFHIINPATGQPLKKTSTSITTTSVLAPTCTLADGMATVLMLFSTPEEAAAWAAQFEHIRCWIGTQEPHIR